jgi:hypothetical protein
MSIDLINWLLNSNEPWTRYRTLVDLLDRPEDDPETQAARNEMLGHPQIQTLMATAASWPPCTRPNSPAGLKPWSWWRPPTSW